MRSGLERLTGLNESNKNKKEDNAMMIGEVWMTADNIVKIAAETGRHQKTVQKWYRTKRLPFAIERLLSILMNGCLEEIHDEWSGFPIDARTGRVHLPDGKSVSAEEIMSVPYRYHELCALRVKLRQVLDEASPL